MMVKDEIPARSEYIGELNNGERGERPQIKNFDDTPILKDVERKAIRSVKRGKAVGPDNITIEIVQCLDEFRIDTLTDFLNKISDNPN